MDKMRLRFAPSPTGALHIGGVRTALYNYLLAKKHGGTFILRIEDTDQTRYVEGAENYILEALKWCNILPAEGPGIGGDFGPYRQSERKDTYLQYAKILVDNGMGYYAFDSADELNALREKAQENKEVFKYGPSNRATLNNSINLSSEEVATKIADGEPYTIRLKVPENRTVVVNDLIRGAVEFDSNQLDDKVMLKTDGMPTYHLANIVDDHLMEITHVIRGEEWLPSTAHHVLLYEAFGWKDSMPSFAHLPLILKPNGKGKLSKRDGAKLGIPVFPLSWDGKTEEDSFVGFREYGFDPKAVINFLAFLGWNPGTEQEIFSLDELAEAFSIDKIGKSGARFDFDKAKWFNQQYILAADNDQLAQQLMPLAESKAVNISIDQLSSMVGMMKERVSFLPEILDEGYYFFTEVSSYDEKMVKKKYKPENKEKCLTLINELSALDSFSAANIETHIKAYIEKHELSFGAIFPLLRLGLSGTMKGPDLFQLIEFLGQETIKSRMETAFEAFEGILLKE